jgi:hypothetical protein
MPQPSTFLLSLPGVITMTVSGVMTSAPLAVAYDKFAIVRHVLESHGHDVRLPICTCGQIPEIVLEHVLDIV